MHLDLDVLDPSVIAGLHLPGDRRLQRRGAAAHAAPRWPSAATVIGIEVTELPGPEAAEIAAGCIAPLFS